MRGHRNYGQWYEYVACLEDAHATTSANEAVAKAVVTPSHEAVL